MEQQALSAMLKSSDATIVRAPPIGFRMRGTFMTHPPLVYVDRSIIREHQFEALRVAMNDLSMFVEESTPRLISYGFYLDESRAHMTVVSGPPRFRLVDLSPRHRPL